MDIVNLIEDTAGAAGCAPAHGLSFYVGTARHRILMDFGPSAAIMGNAVKLGVDLAAVDTAVLSHGHYDHSGGLPAFAVVAPHAVTYVQRGAAGDFYADDGAGGKGGPLRFIGMDREALRLPGLRLIEGDLAIDGELRLLTVEERKHPLPFPDADLLEKRDGAYVPDSFAHEQSLLVAEGDRLVLLSGCAHCGILNILDECVRKCGREPDDVISGFHLMKRGGCSGPELDEIAGTARELRRYRTRFHTCHCTGLEAFWVMKQTLGDQLDYVHCGERVVL